MDTRLRQEGLYLCTGLPAFQPEPFTDPEEQILRQAGADQEVLSK